MKRLLSVTILALLACSPATADMDAQIDAMLDKLNETRSVKGTADEKSYEVLFDAYLGMSAPPIAVGRDFNHFFIHDGMADWSAVRGWAESNQDMARAILTAAERTLFGLPYGREAVSSRYREANLVADLAPNGDLRAGHFPYTAAIDTIAAYACAEVYRLLEAGEGDRAIELQVAILFVLRQCCDREFVEEQLYATVLLTEALSNLRDLFYAHRDAISSENFIELAQLHLPFMRPDSGRLFMPEGDRLVAEILIGEVFDGQGQPDPDAFARILAPIQSADQPLTRFGAAARWRQMAFVHDSKESSLERLGLVYDDWWRRWRVEEYDPILDVPTQLARTNQVRFAAVAFSVQDVTELFSARNVLMTQVYGTTVAAGVCGYERALGRWPHDIVNVYGTYMRKRSNRDPFDLEFGPFKIYETDSRTTIDTAWGRIDDLRPGMTMIWSLGADHTDDRAETHTSDGSEGDILIWPPMKALLRERGLMQ